MGVGESKDKSAYAYSDFWTPAQFCDWYSIFSIVWWINFLKYPYLDPLLRPFWKSYGVSFPWIHLLHKEHFLISPYWNITLVFWLLREQAMLGMLAFPSPTCSVSLQLGDLGFESQAPPLTSCVISSEVPDLPISCGYFEIKFINFYHINMLYFYFLFENWFCILFFRTT